MKLYPSKEQERILIQSLGACRFVYNYFLDRKKTEYMETGKNLTYNMLSKELTQLRKETDWMQDVQYHPLQQSLRSLDVAYNRFFRGQAKFPNFHKKEGKQSMRKVTGWSIQGSKISVMNGMTIRFRGNFPKERQGTLAVSRDASGNWWASTIGEEERKRPKLKKEILGIDMGLTHLAITSDGEKFENGKVFRAFQKKLKKAQQSLCRKQKGSNRRKKAKAKVVSIHRKIANIRNNNLHHVSKKIAGKNHATIAMEDLAVANMMKNRCLSHSIGDTAWGELVRQITYKQEWRGGQVVKIGRFFPSSKTCYSCNFVLSSLPLHIRHWDCPRCAMHHDRDVNAAKVIAKQGGERLGVEKEALAHASASSETTSMKRGCVQG